MPSSAKLIVLEGSSPREEIHLQHPELVISRDPSAGLVIASPKVSRRHARLFQSEDGYWIEDLGSSN
jgi:pSer/pThr/pTyr-binding forkhead associated (FHA) protein